MEIGSMLKSFALNWLFLCSRFIVSVPLSGEEDFLVPLSDSFEEKVVLDECLSRDLRLPLVSGHSDCDR